MDGFALLVYYGLFVSICCWTCSFRFVQGLRVQPNPNCCWLNYRVDEQNPLAASLTAI